MGILLWTPHRMYHEVTKKTRFAHHSMCICDGIKLVIWSECCGAGDRRGDIHVLELVNLSRIQIVLGYVRLLSIIVLGIK